MAYPGRHNNYEAAIRRMVQQALEEQERSFREQYQKDTDQQLLLYLRESAMKLHRVTQTPANRRLPYIRLILWQMRDPEDIWTRILVLLNKGTRWESGTRRIRSEVL